MPEIKYQPNQAQNDLEAAKQELKLMRERHKSEVNPLLAKINRLKSACNRAGGRASQKQRELDEEIARGDVRVISPHEAHAVYGTPLPEKVIDPDFKYDETAYLRAFMEWSNSADNAPMPTKEDFKV